MFRSCTWSGIGTAGLHSMATQNAPGIRLDGTHYGRSQRAVMESEGSAGQLQALVSGSMDSLAARVSAIHRRLSQLSLRGTDNGDLEITGDDLSIGTLIKDQALMVSPLSQVKLPVMAVKVARRDKDLCAIEIGSGSGSGASLPARPSGAGTPRSSPLAAAKAAEAASPSATSAAAAAAASPKVVAAQGEASQAQVRPEMQQHGQQPRLGEAGRMPGMDVRVSPMAVMAATGTPAQQSGHGLPVRSKTIGALPHHSAAARASSALEGGHMDNSSSGGEKRAVKRSETAPSSHASTHQPHYHHVHHGGHLWHSRAEGSFTADDLVLGSNDTLEPEARKKGNAGMAKKLVRYLSGKLRRYTSGGGGGGGGGSPKASVSKGTSSHQGGTRGSAAAVSAPASQSSINLGARATVAHTGMHSRPAPQVQGSAEVVSFARKVERAKQAQAQAQAQAQGQARPASALVHTASAPTAARTAALHATKRMSYPVDLPAYISALQALVENKADEAEAQQKTKYKHDDFEQVFTLANGSFGKAILCRYKKNDTPCVLKSVNKAAIVKRNQQRQLMWERAAVKALTESKCPFVVRAYGMFLDPRQLNFVLEYVPGGELFTLMRAKQRFNEQQAKFYASQVLLALEHMQLRHGIVYRDLKPENVLLDHNGYVKLCDFGFAKVLKRTDRTFTQCGTTDYLAPEIILSKGHNGEVDMWAMGVFIYEMLTGEVPFKGDTPYALYCNIIAGGFKMPSNLSPEAKSVIAGLICVDRTQRLGCSKGGITELRFHPFFRDVDFDAILHQRVVAPYLPPVMHPFDMQCFKDTATPPEPVVDVSAFAGSGKFLELCNRIDARDFPDFDCVILEPSEA